MSGTPGNWMGYGALWMGGLEPYMTESFIVTSFQRLGEKPLNIKIMRNRYSGEPAGYCFVHFQSDEEAINAMHKLNGKPIPNTNPPLRFRLNNANSTERAITADREYSLWIGDLSADIDDYTLYKAFASQYESVRTAKVVQDNSGFSKGYGFIRFSNEEDQKHCLTHMNGYKGLGSKPLKISGAVPKGYKQTSSSLSMTGGYSSSQDYSQYYDASYWQNYSAWQTYYEETAALNQSNYYYSETQQDPSGALDSSTINTTTANTTTGSGTNLVQEDELELIEHSIAIDVDERNREIMERDYNFWDALESSKWLPLDFIESYG